MGSFPLKSRGQNAFIRDTHIFSPKWINDAQVSFYRSVFLFTSSLQGVNINEGAGIQGMAGLAPDADQGFPTLTITNYSTFTGQSGSNAYPKHNKIRSLQYVDRADYSSGKHDVRFGYDNFHNTETYYSGSNSIGTFTFNGDYSGDNFADFLMGYPLSSSRSYFRNLWGNAGNFQAFYAQDNCHTLPNLTLTLGLRWEINPYYNALKGQGSGFISMVKTGAPFASRTSLSRVIDYPRNRRWALREIDHVSETNRRRKRTTFIEQRPLHGGECWNGRIHQERRTRGEHSGCFFICLRGRHSAADPAARRG